MFRFALLAALSCFENQSQKCGSAIDFEFLMSTTDGVTRVRYGFECSQRVNVLIEQLLGKHLNDYAVTWNKMQPK